MPQPLRGGWHEVLHGAGPADPLRLPAPPHPRTGFSRWSRQSNAWEPTVPCGETLQYTISVKLRIAKYAIGGSLGVLAEWSREMVSKVCP